MALVTTNIGIDPRIALIIVIYARYSTDEQSKQSIGDQIDSCKRWLKRNGINVKDIIPRYDEGVSGEKLGREGIDSVRELVRTHQCDVVLGVDVSRFFRDRSEPGKFAGMCVDHNVRFITAHDGVDTNDDKWEERIHNEAAKAAGTNETTSNRIQDASEARWEKGYAMGPLRPGYIRTPIDPNDHAKFDRGPYIDSIDPKTKPAIIQAFEDIGLGKDPKEVAEDLTEFVVPRVGNAKKPEWDSAAVKKLIKTTAYMGDETYKNAAARKTFSTGDHKAERTPKDKIWHRNIEPMVSPTTWRRANSALAARNRNPNPRLSGREHPHTNIPRNGRTPLSGHIFCSICGGAMIGQGRAEGGYRCGNALSGTCWNLASIDRDLTVAAIGRSVVDQLMSLDGAADAFANWTRELVEGRDDLDQRLRNLTASLRDVEAQIDRLSTAIAEHGDLKSLPAKLRDCEAKRTKFQDEIEILEVEVSRQLAPVDRSMILSTATSLATQLASDPTGSRLLRNLIGPVIAVPYNRIDCDLVVLRARFNLNLVALLPGDWKSYVMATDSDAGDHAVTSTAIEIKLHREPDPVIHAADALRLSRQKDPKLSAIQIAEALGISRRTTYDAIKLGKKIEAAGANEPYIELTVQPERASRWRAR